MYGLCFCKDVSLYREIKVCSILGHNRLMLLLFDTDGQPHSWRTLPPDTDPVAGRTHSNILETHEYFPHVQL